MELCSADIRQLEKKGYRARDFSELGDDAIFRLKNRNGFCFFFDKKRRKCKEYLSRPLGCRIYPVNISADGEIVIDTLCPTSPNISPEEKLRKGRQLLELLALIDREAEERMSL